MKILNMVSSMVEEMNANVDRHLEKVIAKEGLDFEEYKKPSINTIRSKCAKNT